MCRTMEQITLSELKWVISHLGWVQLQSTWGAWVRGTYLHILRMYHPSCLSRCGEITMRLFVLFFLCYLNSEVCRACHNTAMWWKIRRKKKPHILGKILTQNFFCYKTFCTSWPLPPFDHIFGGKFENTLTQTFTIFFGTIDSRL